MATPATGSRSSSHGLHAFVLLVLVAGSGCLVSALVAQHADAWRTVGVECYLLGLLLFVGELRAIPVPRGDDATDQITVSSTFATALVIIGPLGLALLVQGIAVAVDDLLHGRPLRILRFNVGQYLLTLSAARLAFCLASGEPIFAVSTDFTPGHIPAALLAGLVYFLVNNGLVATVVALDSGLPMRQVLSDDVRFQVATSSILLGLAPVAAHSAQFSLVMLPLLALPMVGVHSNARMALNRQREALHDSLTGLPNREFLRRRAEKALVTSQANGLPMAVMLLDLDHFKEINDTLGHHVGDEVIREVASRLLDTVGEDVMVARLGGDEFAVVMPGLERVEDARDLASRVVARLRDPVVVEGVRMGIQASIGIAVAPQHADTVGALLKRADIALYRAKGNRGEIQVYRPEIDSYTVERLSLLGDLHSAVENDEFVLVFQPQVCSRTGDTLGVEALLRWLHPREGVVGPDVFIPLAENTGLISHLTRWVVESSVETLARWRANGHDISVSVNISARVLTDIDLPNYVAEVLTRHHVPASRLTVEVTESTIMADPKRASDVLGRLRSLGVNLAVDDFGTGYSSLSYLRRMDVDELKIDKSFVLQMGLDDNSAIIVRSTVELGHSLGLSVTAEGVEDVATLRTLQDLGCDRIQGFHFSRPMQRDAMEAWLNARRTHEPYGLVGDLTRRIP